MPSKHSLSVSLTDHLCAFVDEQVASGGFRSASEVVRAALRLLERDLKGGPAGRDGPGDAPRGAPATTPQETGSSGPGRIP